MTDSKSQEELEFYSASVNAWYSSALEHDKSLLTLSAGGIGLLITLLSTVGLKSYCALMLCALAILCFIVCLISVLKIFNGNRTHIVKLFKGDEDLDNPDLVRLDKIAIWSFILGVVFSALVGVTTAYQQYSEKETKMTDSKTNINKGLAQDSFNGVHNLQKKSFNGVQQLKPPATSSSSTTQTNQTNSTQTSATPLKSEKKN